MVTLRKIHPFRKMTNFVNMLFNIASHTIISPKKVVTMVL